MMKVNGVEVKAGMTVGVTNHCGRVIKMDVVRPVSDYMTLITDGKAVYNLDCAVLGNESTVNIRDPKTDEYIVYWGTAKIV